MPRLVVVFSLVFTCTLVGCASRPSIRLTQTADTVVVHVETLGEYPTTITRVRLTDRNTGEVVLDLTALFPPTDNRSQIYKITLCAGQNNIATAFPEYEAYRAVTPAFEKTFALKRGKEYLIEMWGKSSRASKAVIEFAAPLNS
ncbi:MAG: hypothetical protein ACLPXM_08440 [Terriglobales bacterium]